MYLCIPNHMQKIKFIPEFFLQTQLVCTSIRIAALRILLSDWSIGFWTITQKSDFSQTCSFRRKVEDH